MRVNKLVDTKLLWENAQKNLSVAQAICQESQDTIYNLQSSVTGWQKTISKIEFTINCIENQAIFLVKGILQYVIGNRLLHKEWEREVLVDLVSEMKQSKEEIIAKSNELKLTKDVLGGQDRTLADFISMDNLEILNEKFGDVNIINSQVSNIRKHYDSLVEKVFSQLLKSKVCKLRQEYKRYFDSDKIDFILSPEKSFSRILILENKLVDVLKSLTDHFDKCILLQSRKLPKVEYEELLKIVIEDNGELDSIMSMLNGTATAIGALASEFYKKLDKYYEKQIIIESMNNLLNEFLKYEEYLNVFKGIGDLIATLKKSCNKDITKVKELSNFYANFIASYKELLKEVKRRKQLANKMKRILELCETNLSELSEADLKSRQKFLQEHGDFLPENIWPENIDDLDPLYFLKYEIKEI